MFFGTAAGELRCTPYARNNCVIASSGAYGSFAYATSFAGTSSQLISNALLLDQISGLAERIGDTLARVRRGGAARRAQQLPVKIEVFVTRPLFGQKKEQGALRGVAGKVSGGKRGVAGNGGIMRDDEAAQGFLAFVALKMKQEVAGGGGNRRIRVAAGGNKAVNQRGFFLPQQIDLADFQSGQDAQRHGRRGGLAFGKQHVGQRGMARRRPNRPDRVNARLIARVQQGRAERVADAPILQPRHGFRERCRERRLAPSLEPDNQPLRGGAPLLAANQGKPGIEPPLLRREISGVCRRKERQKSEKRDERNHADNQPNTYHHASRALVRTRLQKF